MTKSGRGANEFRVRAPDGFACVLADAVLVYAVGAAGKDENRLAGNLAAKDERFDYLSDLAADACGGIGGSTRAFLKFDDRAIKPQDLQCLLDF